MFLLPVAEYVGGEVLYQLVFEYFCDMPVKTGVDGGLLRFPIDSLKSQYFWWSSGLVVGLCAPVVGVCGAVMLESLIPAHVVYRFSSSSLSTSLLLISKL